MFISKLKSSPLTDCFNTSSQIKATFFFPQSKTILPLFEVARVLMLALYLWFLSKLFLPHHLKCDVKLRNLGIL